MSKISWLHFSDLHINAEDTFDQDIIHQAFFDDIIEQLTKYDLKLDFIFFTGDVAYTASQKDYKIAINFFNRLCDVSHINKENLFIIPGNHDVDRYKVSKLLDDYRKEFDTREEVRKIITDKELFQQYLTRFNNYSNFISELYSIKFEMTPDNYYTANNRTVNRIRFGIIGLNSVWASYGGRHDSNNIYISEVQIREALNKVKNSSIRIALLHHPPSWLYEEDKADIENLLYSHFRIVLHGHLHRPDFQIVNSIKGQQIIIPAGAIYLGRRVENSYNITSLDISKDKIRITPRRYSDVRRKFFRDVDTLGDDNANYFEMDIPEQILVDLKRT